MYDHSFFYQYKMRNKNLYFEEAFLLDDINIDVALEISFFTFSNIKIDFVSWYLQLKTYTIAKIFFIKKQIKLVRKKRL